MLVNTVYGYVQLRVTQIAIEDVEIYTCPRSTLDDFYLDFCIRFSPVQLT